MAADKTCWLFYHVQNDKGESGAHPNAVKLRPAEGQQLSLQDVVDAFPLTGTGSFHFRFQVVQDKQLMFLDLTHPADIVPLVGSNVICKVLRLDTVKCASRFNTGLQLKSYAPGAASARSTRTTGVSSGSGTPSAQSSAAAMANAVAIMSMPAMKAGAAHHDVAKEIDGETHIRDTGDSEDIYKKLKAVDERGMRPVKAVVIDASVLASPPLLPSQVDADLQDKSAYVQAKVMQARQEAEKAAQQRLAEVAEREAKAVADASARDAARGELEVQLRAWGTEAGGKQVKPIRTLLATMHTVLWEGAKWEVVPMAKLVVPTKVKNHFLKACTVVHPDKASNLGAREQYIAGQVFDYINVAFRDFQEKELS